MSRTKTLLIGLLGCTLTLAVGCKQNYPSYNTRFSAFGTLVDLNLVDVEPGLALRVADAIQKDFEYMDRTWRSLQPGPLTRVNALLPTLEPFVAPPSLIPLLLRSKEVFEQSQGLFNPALGELIELWGFDVDDPKCHPPPPPAAISALVEAAPGMQDLHIEGIHAWSTNPKTKLDFGSYAKGYGLDMAIQHLRDMGVDNALLSAGGDLRAIGTRDGRPWRIAIRSPSGGGVLATVNVSGDESVVSTGESERNFLHEGQQYHHILDPRTGYPARLSRAVTVIHTDAATADAATHALFIAGPEEWHALARSMGIRYVMLVDQSDRIHMNPAMAERIKLLANDQEVVISPPLIE